MNAGCMEASSDVTVKGQDDLWFSVQ